MYIVSVECVDQTGSIKSRSACGNEHLVRRIFVPFL